MRGRPPVLPGGSTMDHLHDKQGRVLSLTRRTARQAADAYCVIETVLGPAFLAYNDCGISALLQAETSDLFEQVFQARFHRMAYRDSSPPAALLDAVRDCLAGRADPSSASSSTCAADHPSKRRFSARPPRSRIVRFAHTRGSPARSATQPRCARSGWRLGAIRYRS